MRKGLVISIGVLLGAMFVMLLQQPVVTQQISRIFATYNGGPIALQGNSTGALSVTVGAGGGGGGGTVPATSGGTGQSTYAKGDVLAGGTNTLNKIAIGTDGWVLTADAVSTYGMKWAVANAGVKTQDIEYPVSCSGSTTAFLNNYSFEPSYTNPTGSCLNAATKASYGRIDFTDAERAIQTAPHYLPANWNSAVAVTGTLWWGSAVADAGKNIKWWLASACTASGEASQTFNSYEPQVSASTATTDKPIRVDFTAIPMTNCAAGESVVFRIYRLNTDGQDTLGGTGSLYHLTIRWTLTP